MIRIEQNGLAYYQFESLLDFPVHQGIFTRIGGLSPQPWDSLNLGGLSGDTRENIIENRRRIFSCFNLPVESIFDVWQVHGNKVICTETPRPLDGEHTQADAIFTNKTGITLFMRFADCVPLFFYDHSQNVIGIAHAGRIGTINRIAKVCVQTMLNKYGSSIEDIVAMIGPSIGPDHYEVKNDVLQLLQMEFEDYEKYLEITKDGRKYLDLWKLNHDILAECGIGKIEISQICTACNIQEWFSHRGENGKTGRFGTLLALKEI